MKATVSVRGRGRQLLLAAARDIFAERGYKGTSTRDIAERAGVTEVMIFRHFGTKATLFQEAVVAPFTSFIQQYMADYRGREHGVRSPYEEGLDLYTGLFEVLHGEREVLLALMAARQFDDLPTAAASQVDEAFADVLTLIEEVVGTESVERGFSGFDLGPTVRAMFAMVLSLALHGDWMGLQKDAAYRQVIEAMTTLTVRGLQVPEG
ncbi:helix-turn-helix domain containing protein [Mycobacterium sp. CVI_P3]|uniref:Helix-turn-helix domain containing protein n=1 Tax=Mycobacterium pinniadriaticum TaxID=2994102 RepID=A0ABT3SA55_9MYCO|nr:TetR/AcrR family transcriptional regulator [Mycobacterium pinniadriaticum]MCX2929977.1 helix-turn-helix domain containing protein [Mycobacterium pinniadriaticum]MCX2936374.1 helix-turn-helix domain containing protein [Mycobacterium pinniadriaticum]